jgi:hypothetical protein
MLVEELCGRLGLGLFTLHDFDVSGFSIKQTLVTSNRRYTFKRKVNAIGLGLRLADVEALGLTPERVSFGKESKDALRRRLARNGALPDEIDFLLSGQGQNGQRVELNAMTSDQFVAIVERRLTEHGAAKVVPSADTLAQAFVAFRRGEMAQQALEAELARLNAGPVDIPADLDERVRAYLDEHPEATWDAAVRAIIEEDDDEEDEIGDRP